MLAGERYPSADLDLRALAQRGVVHFIGVSGAGVSALAELVLRAGGQVTGCDLRPGEVGSLLEGLGATIWRGHDPAHIEEAVAVVTTSALPPDHPELIAAKARGIPVMKRAEALGALVNRGRVIAIAGTHGKTTTTAMTTSILAEAGLDPTGFVGGQVPGWTGGLRPGGDEIFVVEADEYDRSFLTLRPEVAVVTAIDADHLDIYGSLEGVEGAFSEFVSPLLEGGLLVASVDDAGSRRLLTWARESGAPMTLGYGLGEGAELRAVGVEARGRGTHFVVEEWGQELVEVELAVPGLHNVSNALAAFAVARYLGVDPELAGAGLGRYRGVSRRFEVLGEAGGIIVVDDYAHHPTEVAATLSAARATYPDRRLVALFQPHLYTRTEHFATELGEALSRADEVWVTDIYPAREAPIEGVTGELVADAIRRLRVRGVATSTRAAGGFEGLIHYEPELGSLGKEVMARLVEGDIVVTMGAGDITEVAHEVFARLGGEV